VGTEAEGVLSPNLDRVRLAVLVSGGGLAGMAQMAIVPSLPQLAAHFADKGDGTFIAQQIMTIAGPALAIGAPLFGWMAGHVGKRPIFLLSALLYAFAGIAGAFAPNLWTLLFTRFLLGIASGGIGATSMGLLADHYEGAVRDRLIGWVTTVGGAATLVSLAAAGALVEFGGWQAPFGLYLVGVLMFLAGWPVISGARPAAPVGHAASGGSIRAAFGFLVLIIVLSVVMNMVAVQGIFLLQAEGIASPTVQSIVIDMSTVGTMLGGYAFGHLKPRLTFSPILSLIWLLLGAGAVGFALADTAVTLGLFAFVAGLGAGLVAPLTMSAILAVVPPAANARAMGLAIGAIFLGLLLNPFVVKPLRSAFGFQGPFLWIGGAALACSAVILLWRTRGRGVQAIGHT
jgi:MFS family permease